MIVLEVLRKRDPNKVVTIAQVIGFLEDIIDDELMNGILKNLEKTDKIN